MWCNFDVMNFIDVTLKYNGIQYTIEMHVFFNEAQIFI